MLKDREKIKILFLCTGNSCRSQMAEGLTNHLKGESIKAYSAGVSPHYKIMEETFEVMSEIGIDMKGHHPKDTSEFKEPRFDYVITLCDNARESCPVFSGDSTVIHKGFEDPFTLASNSKSDQEALEHYRRIRDEIREYIIKLPNILEREG